MARVTVHVQPMDPNRIGAVLLTSTGSVATYVHKEAVTAATYAQSIVPVRTGRLRASIRAEQNRSPLGRFSIGWLVTANTPYAKFVEFGTRYMAARPYLRPALVRVLGRG